MDSRCLCFYAEECPINFGTWLRQTQRYLTSQCQDGATLYAHASGALQAPPRLEPLPAVPPPTPEAQADYARLVLAWDVWDSRDAAAALVLTELLPPTKAAHFDLVETAKEVYDAISARYSTPSSASLSRILMPLVFPNLGSFATVSDLATHLCSLVASYRAACTEAQLLVAPPPIWLTVHWSLRTLQLFLPLTGRNGGREARKGGRGVAAVEEVAVVEAALGPAMVAVAVVPQVEVLTRLLEEVQPAVVRGSSSNSHSSSSHNRDSSSSRDSSSGRHHSNFSHGDHHCSGVRSSTGALRHNGELEDPGALAAVAAALPAGPLAPCGETPAPVTTGASLYRAVPVSAGATTTLWRGACVASGPDTPPAEASLSFTLDSGVSQCFFRDHTTLTPLLAPVPVALADPSLGPAVARSSTTLPFRVVPSGVLRGLHIPTFTRNLVGAVLATFTRESHSGCYVLHTECSPIASFAQVAASPQVPLSSPLAVSGQERYFLVVIDDYSRYTTAFPLAKKSEVTSTLIWWLLATKSTRGSRVRCLHSVRGCEFHSGVLAGLYGEQGIRQSWTLPESPQQNGVAERRIGLVMDIARTSTIHARVPHFLWPYALPYATHQLNLQSRVLRPEVSPTSLWTGSPSVGSAFHVWGCLALVRDTSVDKLSARAIPCVFLGFPVASPSPQSSSQSPQQPSALPRHVTVDSVGVGAGGAATGGTRSGGARSRGAGAGGAGAGGASSGGAGAGGSGTGGASFGGAGAGGAGTRGASSGGAGAGGASSGGVGAGGAGTGGASSGGAGA
ncbi:unnamed protein product [Closterium sp. NIES-54]